MADARNTESNTPAEVHDGNVSRECGENGVSGPLETADIPTFAKGFPEDPELLSLLQAFHAGRYDVVRERAPQLARKTDNPEVARAASELRKRLDADPLAVKLLLGAVALLVLLTSWAYLAN